jgi:hypothetical protein
MLATLGALRRPSIVIVMKPALSIFAKVRVRFGCARPLSCTSAATDCGFLSRMMARRARFSGVCSRTTASTELKLGSAASAALLPHPVSIEVAPKFASRDGLE